MYPRSSYGTLRCVRSEAVVVTKRLPGLHTAERSRVALREHVRFHLVIITYFAMVHDCPRVWP